MAYGSGGLGGLLVSTAIPTTKRYGLKLYQLWAISVLTHPIHGGYGTNTLRGKPVFSARPRRTTHLSQYGKIGKPTEVQKKPTIPHGIMVVPTFGPRQTA